MEEMYYVVSIFLALTISAITLLIIKKRKERKLNEVIPHIVGKKTIYLRRHEIPHFESLSRNDQRKIVNRGDARIKKGKVIPVTKGNKVMGYIPKT